MTVLSADDRNNPAGPARVAARCEALARGCLLAVILCLPWSFGGNDPFSQALMFPALIAAQTFALVARGLNRSSRTTLNGATAVLALSLLLAVAQLVSWPEQVTSGFSPTATAVRRELQPDAAAPDFPQLAALSAGQRARPTTISIAPPATRRKLTLLICAAAVWFLAGKLFRTDATRWWLAALTAINGAALAYFGIVQRLTWTGELYWSIPSPASTAFGPFVNRNAGAGYLVLCLSGVVYLWWQAFPARPAGRARRLSAVWQDLRLALQGEQAGWLVGVMAVAASLIAGILVAMSRGAWLGTTVASLALLAIQFRRARSPGLLVVVAGGLMVAIGLLSWLNLTDVVHERLSTLTDTDIVRQGRWHLWRDILDILPDYWRSGSGLGTFRFVQPHYQTSPMTAWFDEAENMFLQVAVEAGVGGVILVCVLIALCARALWSGWSAAEHPAQLALISLGVWALISQGVCSTFDFGLNFPANLLLLSVLLGAACSGTPLRLADRWKSWAATAWSAILLVALGWSYREASWAGGVDLVLNRGESKVDEHALTREDIDESLRALELCLPHRPDDAEGHVRYAGLLIVRYRQEARDQLQRELGGAVDPKRLWEVTSPLVLHGRAAEFALTGDADRLAALQNDEIVQRNLRPALEHALLARADGPWLPRAHEFLAQLSFLGDRPLADAPHIARALWLRPQDPALRFWAGVLHVQSDRDVAALAEWQRCLMLSSQFDERILQRAAQVFTTEVVCHELLPDSPEVLVRVGAHVRQSKLWEAYRRPLGERLQDVLQSLSPAVEQAAERQYWSGLSDYWSEDFDAAVTQLTDAVRQRPMAVDWRVSLAEALRDQGEVRQALKELATAVRLDPRHPRASSLFESLLAAEKRRIESSSSAPRH